MSKYVQFLTRLRTEFARLSHVRLALGLIWEAAAKWTVVWGILLIIQGVLPASMISVTKWLVDSVTAAIGEGAARENVVPILIPAAIMAGLMLLQRVFASLAEWVRVAQAEYVQDHIKSVIHEKAASVDFSFYESAEYYDRLEQVNSQASSRTLALLQNIGGTVQSTVTLLSIAVILLAYTAWLPLVLIVSTFPAFLIVLHFNRRHHSWWTQTTPARRWAQYYDLMLTLQSAAAEVRINDLGGLFKAKYATLRRELRAERLDLLRRQAIASLMAGGVALLVTGATMGWIVLRSLRGFASLGDIAVFYQAFNQAQSVMSALLQNASQIYTNSLFVEQLTEFLAQQNHVQDSADPVPFPSSLKEGICFENVTFTYPGSHEPALDRFSIDIPAGKIVAVVGENGAGKSTLIKLLCRFYDPDQGAILADGLDLRAYEQSELRRQVSVMFQFPTKYQMTASQNVGLGDLHQKHTERDIEVAAQAAGAHEFIERLPQKYETLLGRWLAEGRELSGGQWQRLALARAFLRQAPLVILDEPTNFMDSWAENEWLARFRKLVRGRTSLVITHRFTTAMQADLIYVMDQGRVVESGTHAELLVLGGRYATSWNAQMEAGAPAEIAG